MCPLRPFSFFFFNDTATTEIYTLSLHDALPISAAAAGRVQGRGLAPRPDVPAARGTRRGARARLERHAVDGGGLVLPHGDRKSTRLNSSHSQISYAVFCLKKKKNT